MPAAPKVLDRLLDRLEQAEILDKPSDLLAAALRRVIKPGAIEDTLSGTQLGHPAHPAVVALPIGAWTSVVVLDVLGADERATKNLVALGIVSALPAGLTGSSDWLSTAGAERRVGLVHAWVVNGALALQGASWFARRRGARGAGAALSGAALALVSVGGWLGGHLAYAMGVGVDTTAFQKYPAEWTDVAPLDDIGDQPLLVEVDSVPFLLYRAGNEIVAMADRCTHRGAPLHEGKVTDGCITCPWHDSVFGPDGSVRSGPATRPQPTLEVRLRNGRVEVRRDEPRSLRTNPVGP